MIRVAMGLVLIWVWGDLVLKGPRSGWVTPVRRVGSGMLYFIHAGFWGDVGGVTTGHGGICGQWGGLGSVVIPSQPPAPLLVGPKGPLAWLFAALIFVQTGLVAFAAWVSPLNAWDAWVNFASKASILFQDQALSPALYQDVSRLPTNLDYPLMLPISEAWLYTWAGGWRNGLREGLPFCFMRRSLHFFMWRCAECCCPPQRWVLRRFWRRFPESKGGPTVGWRIFRLLHWFCFGLWKSRELKRLPDGCCWA